MAAVFVLAMGIGGWLMYEAYKGQTVSGLETKLKTVLGASQGVSAQTTAVTTANSEQNMLDAAANMPTGY